MASDSSPDDVRASDSAPDAETVRESDASGNRSLDATPSDATPPDATGADQTSAAESPETGTSSHEDAPTSEDDVAHAPTALPDEPVRRLRPTEGVSGRSSARMTLFGTALVFTVTLFAWGGAKVACNLHPPAYQAFKPAPLSRLASTPKDGALEFHHRLSLRNFAGARELATGAGVSLVEGIESSCDSTCKAEAEARANSVVTRAVVLSRQGSTAVVRAESFYRGAVDTRTYRVTWEERLWKVVGEDG